MKQACQGALRRLLNLGTILPEIDDNGSGPFCDSIYSKRTRVSPPRSPLPTATMPRTSEFVPQNLQKIKSSKEFVLVLRDAVESE